MDNAVLALNLVWELTNLISFHGSTFKLQEMAFKPPAKWKHCTMEPWFNGIWFMVFHQLTFNFSDLKSAISLLNFLRWRFSTVLRSSSLLKETLYGRFTILWKSWDSSVLMHYIMKTIFRYYSHLKLQERGLRIICAWKVNISLHLIT
jgi:hypothetical protein